MSMIGDDRPPGSDAARNAELLLTAAENVSILIAQLQQQISELNAVTTEHEDKIARLAAATLCHACPAGCEIYDPNMEALKPANIGECGKAGMCHCEIGYILTAATWTPPTKGDSADGG